MRGNLSYGAESSQEDNTAEHGHQIPKHHQQKEPSIPNMEEVWSLLSRWEIPLV